MADEVVEIVKERLLGIRRDEPSEKDGGYGVKCLTCGKNYGRHYDGPNCYTGAPLDYAEGRGMWRWKS